MEYTRVRVLVNPEHLKQRLALGLVPVCTLNAGMTERLLNKWTLVFEEILTSLVSPLRSTRNCLASPVLQSHTGYYRK